jgi:class 3 adenylate cyclase
MNCASCGSANREGRRFCGQCGAALAKPCAACGAANDAGERFCGQCGAALVEIDAAEPPGIATPLRTASPTVDPSRTAERRHVSVLFADLVGFTSLSGQRDAEDVRELLGRYFDTARTVITRYGGTVEKFIGDAVMAVWGAQSIQENDAERAVRAALELVDAVAAFGEQVGAPGLMARAGVLTGEAVVSVGAVGEGMVAGDLVNTASRVQSVAEPGTVYVGDATRQVTEAAIIYEDAGAHELKGKPEPVRLWRAKRIVAARGGALRPTGLEPPFVGRDREIRLRKEYLHATAEEAKARLLSIVGVGGVGKSRLAWEFFKYVDGLSQEIFWHRGRCLAYGEGVAYWALSEMVRMRTGIVENEPPESASEKLRRSVGQFVPEEEERRWVEPALAHLLGIGEGVATEPRGLYAGGRGGSTAVEPPHPAPAPEVVSDPMSAPPAPPRNG